MFFNTKTLRANKMYENKKHGVYIMLSEDIKIIQVFNKGLLFKIPLNILIEDQDDIERALDKIADLNIDLNSQEELEEMLAFYEEIEDYEKCKEIKDIIKKKNKK
jgi:hypothetical protein